MPAHKQHKQRRDARQENQWMPGSERAAKNDYCYTRSSNNSSG